MMAPGGPRATVVSADGGLYRLPVLSAEARSAKAESSLEAGAAIGEHESVRTGPGAHAVLRLADGSMVDVNERTELFVTAAWSGQAIHLQRGDIIVKAAKQRRGRLQVLTHDSIASVKGTVFAVSAGMRGISPRDPEALMRITGYATQYDTAPRWATGFTFLTTGLLLYGYARAEAERKA